MRVRSLLGGEDPLEEGMATHCRILAWRTPWTKEPGATVHGVTAVQFSSVTVMSNSLRPRESQHTRPPCPSPSPRVHSDSHPSGQ